MKPIAAVAPMLLALAACQTYPPNDPYGPSGYPPQAPYPEPYPPYPPTSPYPPPAPYPTPPGAGDYRALGTEPFWDLTIGSRDMIFTDRGTGLTVSQPTPTPISGTAGPIYRTQRLEVNVTHTPCSDGMSDRTYPDTVQVRVDGRLYRGCGTPGDTLAPIPPTQPLPPVSGIPGPQLDRTRWTVAAINGRRTPPTGNFSMEFDEGRLSARFGCNNIGAGYTQTGAALDAGAILATKMACPDMSWETQGIAVLDQTMQAQALGRNRMVLTSSAGSLELVRR